MTGEKKDRRSLFEISNSAFVESLSSNTSFLDAKHIPKKVRTLICLAYHYVTDFMFAGLVFWVVFYIQSSGQKSKFSGIDHVQYELKIYALLEDAKSSKRTIRISTLSPNIFVTFKSASTFIVSQKSRSVTTPKIRR